MQDCSLLTNKDISSKYKVTVRKKFDTFQEISKTHSPNDKYKNFITAHMGAAEKARLELHKNVSSFFDKSREKHLMKQQLYGHLPLISKIIQVRRTRHEVHC